jgi:phosphoenolpyruvate carboxylase
MPHALDSNKEEPLRNDIRLLGRILGDTVREQEGEAVFDIVERVRQTPSASPATATRPPGPNWPPARPAAARYHPVVVRAFSYFLQLANIAEDEHHIRRRRAHDLAGSPPREGSLIHALDAWPRRVSPEAIADFFAHALVAPVLTAHPTEVQRQSLIRNHRDIARLLDQRERLRMTPEEEADNDLGLANAILTLWQSRMLRPVRLKVLDEVKNGITYFNETFFTELPRLYIQATQQLQKRFPDQRWALPPFFRVGSWIGGDRDGNPFVTADILREALRLQSAAALNHYLAEVHELGGELPLPTCWSRSRRNCWPSPNTPPTIRRNARTSLTAAPCPASTRASRPLPASSTASSRCATRSARPNPTPRRTACAPTSRYWPTRSS